MPGVLGPSLLMEALMGRHIHLGLIKVEKELLIDKYLFREENLSKDGVYRGGKIANRAL